MLAVDNFVLHNFGRRPDLAHQFIDFMLDGANVDRDQGSLNSRR